MRRGFMKLFWRHKIEESEVNANEAWKDAADRRVRYLAQNKRMFTSEDVLTWLDRRGYKTKDNRALGAIMQRYAKSGWIKACGWTTATRRERHNAPVRMWLSQIKGFAK